MRDRDALREGWAEVIATRDSAPADCPCRAVTAPLIAAWKAWDRRQDTIDQQWLNLRAARNAQRAPGALAPRAGDFALDVRTPAECERTPRDAVNIPVDELSDRLAEVPIDARVVVYCASGMRAGRAVHLLRAAGYHACNGHEPSCELPEVVNPQKIVTDVRGDGWKKMKLVDNDPRMAGPADALMGIFGGLTKGLDESGQQAARGAIGAAGEAARAEIPGVAAAVAAAVKGEVPGVVQAAGAAARPVAKDIASEAGEAAGRGAAGGAKAGAASSAPVIVIGLLGVVGAVVGIGYASSRKRGKV